MTQSQEKEWFSQLHFHHLAAWFILRVHVIDHGRETGLAVPLHGRITHFKREGYPRSILLPRSVAKNPKEDGVHQQYALNQVWSGLMSTFGSGFKHKCDTPHTSLHYTTQIPHECSHCLPKARRSGGGCLRWKRKSEYGRSPLTPD